MRLDVELISVKVIRPMDSTDTILLEFEGPSPFPNWIPDYKPKLELVVAKETGVEYCEEVLGIPLELIEIIEA